MTALIQANLASAAGMFIVDETLRVISADDAGRETLEHGAGLRLILGRLCTGSMSLNAQLRDDVLCGAPASDIRLGSVGGADVALSVRRLASLDGSTHQAIVMVRAEQGHHDNIGKVQAACELTATETEVLRLIYKGLSTVEVAGVMGVAKTTVRTHLRHIFDKTETSRQSELVHFVASWQAW